LRGHIAAALFAGSVSLALIAGALVFQYAWDYPPCEICHWQRWPHILSAVAGLGGGLLLAAKILPARAASTFAWLAIAAIAAAGALGVYHSGIEWGWWEGPAACTGPTFTPGSGADFTPFRFIRCDEAAWRFLGISLAGYNAIISFGVAAAAMSMMLRRGQ
jgi:disulfide bond formation protein DsbB